MSLYNLTKRHCFITCLINYRRKAYTGGDMGFEINIRRILFNEIVIV